MSAIQKAISIVGAQAIADEFGITVQAVHKWGEVVPIERCPRIERLTGGQVTRRELRPSDWREIWPELAEKDGKSRKQRTGRNSNKGGTNA